MNIIPPRLVLLVAVIMVFSGMSGQSNWNAKRAVLKTNGSVTTSPTISKKQPEITSVYRYHSRLPKTHSGIVIELTASNLPLAKDYPIFKQFGDVYYDKLREGGYSYVVKTNFSTPEAAIKFLTQIILPKAPEARVIQYKEGKRNPLSSYELRAIAHKKSQPRH